MGKGDDKDMDDATVVAGPSFDAMLEARGEGLGDDEMTAVQASAYDDETARDAVRVHDADAFAATAATAASYDARLDAMGLPIPGDIEPGAQTWGEDKPGDAPGVPKTMVLSPQQWGLPAPPQQPAPPAPHAQAQPSSPQPYSPQPYSPPPYSPPQPYSPQPYSPQHAVAAHAAPARSKSSLTLFLISAAVTLLVFGTCAAGVIAYLVVRG